jgi:TatD DNase family protein
MIFFDTHAHLPLLEHSPVNEVLDRATAAGVTEMVTVATELSNWESSRAFAQASPGVYYTVGLHPHQAQDWPNCEAEIGALFAQGVPPKCVGIGETGMDFHYNFADRETQIRAFEGQLQVAKKYNLPLIIHCREAFADLFASIQKHGLGPAGGVMHCFTGGAPDAKGAIALGLKISFSGILTFKNAEPLREAAHAIGLSEIVLETDCPYLAPIPNRGKPNEPSFLPHTAAVLATTLGVTIAEVAEKTTANARRLFQLP